MSQLIKVQFHLINSPNLWTMRVIKGSMTIIAGGGAVQTHIALACETAVILIDTIPWGRHGDRSAAWSRPQKGFLCSVAPAILYLPVFALRPDRTSMSDGSDPEMT